MAYWYPTGSATFAADANYIIEETTNKFFTSSSSLTLIASASLSFNVDGLDHTEFIIGATGVNTKITCTTAGTSA
jgi:hypothetical protein